MAFCAFDDTAALFDSTPVENMFITEYMLRAPGDFVKVYLYGLMLCYHPSPRMSVAAMARDLDLTEEEVERAFKYWARDGLVRQVGDNPVSYAYMNIKQLTLTQAKNPGEKLYNREFAEEIQRIFGKRTVGYSDYQTIYAWVDELELPEEVVLMFLQQEIKNAGSRFSFKIADKRAKEWAQRGVRTVEDAEKVIMLSGEREKELRKLLGRLGQRRAPSDDEKALYSKWIDEWGFAAEAVLEACKETTKGTPTMAYLDGILLRQHQLGRHEAAAMAYGLKKEKTERDFVREVYQALGTIGFMPTQEDVIVVKNWYQEHFDDELIKRAAAHVHKKTGSGNLDDIDRVLHTWQDMGLSSVEDVNAFEANRNAQNAKLRQIYMAAGLEKRTNNPDRSLLERWTEEYGMTMELMLLAAEYAKGSNAPMMTINRMLSDWYRAGIKTTQAAEAEHVAHVRVTKGSRASGVPEQSTMMSHSKEERDAAYLAALVDFDEEGV